MVLKRVDSSARVQAHWDRLEVQAAGDEPERVQALTEALKCIPGIANFARVQVHKFADLDDIFQKTLAIWGEALVGKTFSVRVKRNGKHEFSSTDVERYVGGGLRQHCRDAEVKLKAPDVVVKIEVRDELAYIVEEAHAGLGGFPIGTQEPVLSLISGGFDSTVASYFSIKRGMRTHFVFFNLGGKEHELGVKEIAFYLWNRYGSSHRVKFISVPFEPIVADILEHVDPSCMGVILKQQMLRAASAIAERAQAGALVTGEAVAQVSSQTLTNLAIIDRAADTLVLRPLALMNKGDIIDQCRAIGAEEFAAVIPEYCGVISVRPSAHLKSYQVEHEQGKLTAALIDQALEAASVQNIDEVMIDLEQNIDSAPLEVVQQLDERYVVIDIRHPDEVQLRPVPQQNGRVLAIPFYSLSSRFANLDAQQHYLLYCTKGVMSQLHAAHLRDAGYTNVGVYRP